MKKKTGKMIEEVSTPLLRELKHPVSFTNPKDILGKTIYNIYMKDGKPAVCFTDFTEYIIDTDNHNQLKQTR